MRKTLMLLAVFSMSAILGVSALAEASPIDAASPVAEEMIAQEVTTETLVALSVEPTAWLGITNTTGLRQCNFPSTTCFFNEQCPDGCPCVGFCCEVAGGPGGD